MSERTMPCWECGGSGVVADEDKRCVRCPACDDGWIVVVPASQLAAAMDVIRRVEWANDGACPICNGFIGSTPHADRCVLAAALRAWKGEPA